MDNSNYLVTIIIGDENSNYDGSMISRSYFNSHTITLNKMQDILACIGYDLDYMGKTDLNDIIYELIFNGHIVFLNISCDSRKIGCLYLPLNITDNQKETLENFYLQLKDYELLKYTINKENMENFLVLNDDIVDNEKVKKKQKF